MPPDDDFDNNKIMSKENGSYIRIGSYSYLNPLVDPLYPNFCSLFSSHYKTPLMQAQGSREVPHESFLLV